MKIQLRRWLKMNRVMLINAGSLVCTTLITGIMGFAYWWVAARQFHPGAVGLASAAISAMMLLGAFCVLGLGTLLIGELPRQTGKEASLISTALLLVGTVGGLTGTLFALLAPFISADFGPLRTNIGSVLIFAIGVSLTSITIVLDQALIGLLRGEWQFWRNTFFAITKLGVLFGVGLTLHSNFFHRGGVAIYATWAIGNAISLLPLALFVLIKKRFLLKHIMPDWSLLRRLGWSALQHHMLNLIQQVPTTALPVLVTILLSAKTNAWFYMAWMISGFVFTASYALTTVLYAINTAPPEEITRKIRMTLNLALITSLGANIVIQIAASQILGLFGHTYAEQAAWSLRIVSLAAFPMIIKFHYLAIRRIHRKLLHALLPVTIGSLIELGTAALGAHLGDLIGLSLGWATAICIEAIFMSPAVFKAVRFRPAKETLENIEVREEHPLLKSIFCPQCSLILPAHAKFCGSCGEHIEQNNNNEETVSLEKIPNGEIIDNGEIIGIWVVPPTEHTQGDAPTPLPKLFHPRDGAPTRGMPLLKTASSIATVVLPCSALILWYISLQSINLRNMTDLGLVSVLPPTIIIPLFLLTISFCLALWQKKTGVALILLHILILLFMLYGITALIEVQPRFDVVYRHAGYTDYIIRHGNVDAGLDAYFDWAGFFIFNAFLTQIAGYSSVLSYAAWSPFFLNLIYFLPLFVIYTSATTDKRIIWFSIWFFYLTNWIGQDYFSPQGLNFFLYLVIIAILVKWFKIPPKDQLQSSDLHRLHPVHLFPPIRPIYSWLTAPDTSITSSTAPQRVALLISLIAIFGLMVFSHPLTPFLMIASVTALIIFRRCKPFWLPLLMIVMTTTWILIMAQPYLVGNLNTVIGDFSHVNSVVTQNVTNRALTGDKEHNLISNIRLLMTAFIWGFALVGGILRLRKGYHDATYVLLAIAPFPVLFVQSYGGEMLLRIYLFTLPMMTFFASAALFTSSSPKTSMWIKGITLATCFVLLGTFFFTRYGNEHMDYITPEELAGVNYLYSIAPTNSLFLEAWDGTPWQAQGFELYNTDSLGEDIPKAVIDGNVNGIIQHIHTLDNSSPRVYLIITRTQKATATSDGLQPGTLDHLEKDLLKSKRFMQIYTNRDTQIFMLIDPQQGYNYRL